MPTTPPLDAASREAIDSAVRQALADERRHSRRRAAGLIVALTAVAVAVGSATRAWAQSCTSSLPAPLVSLCADQPALAADLNANTLQLVTWLQQKVGTVGNANVAVAGTLNVAGALNANSALNVTGTLTAAGAANASSGSIGTLSSTNVTATNLNVTGALDVGLEMVRCTSTLECLCPAGKTVLSGGCWTDNAVRFSRPMRRGSLDGWTCARQNDGNLLGVYAVCARVSRMSGAIGTEP